MNIDFPYRFDGRGRTAETDDDEHVRDMIEQLLFTAPGERVNRPDALGAGALELVFAPNGDALAAATRLSVQAALQEWLGDVIEVSDVDVEASDATLRLDGSLRRPPDRRDARRDAGALTCPAPPSSAARTTVGPPSRRARISTGSTTSRWPTWRRPTSSRTRPAGLRGAARRRPRPAARGSAG